MFATKRTSIIGLVAAVVLTAALPMVALASVENDERSGAIVISDPLPFVDSRDTSEATADLTDPAPSCVSTVATVWYSYTASDYMDLQADTFGSDYDTTLSVYRVQSDESLLEIACNDDFDGLTSWVTFWVEPGDELLIMVGSFGDSPGGNLTVTLQPGMNPPFEEIAVELSVGGATVNRGTGHVTVHGTITCSIAAEAFVGGEIRQRVGRSYIYGSLFGFTSCGPDPTAWSATTEFETGVFAGGQAQVQLFAEAWAPSGYGFASHEEAIRVRMGR